MSGNYRGGGNFNDPWRKPDERRDDRDHRRSRDRNVAVDFRDFPSDSYNRSPSRRSPPRSHHRSRSPGRPFQRNSVEKLILLRGMVRISKLWVQIFGNSPNN